MVVTSVMGGGRYFGEKWAPPSETTVNASVHGPRPCVNGSIYSSDRSCCQVKGKFCDLLPAYNMSTG